MEICMRRRQRGLQFYRKKKGLSMQAVKEVFSWIVLSVLAVFLAFMVIWAVGLRTNMIGVSMEPSLQNGQEVLVNRFIYKLFSPRRGDVVVFLPNGNKNSHYYLKRIIGLPGEKIQIIGGYVYVNGELLEEEEFYDKIADAGIAENEITLGNDEYFVLGDNRNNSEDSRSGNIGAVKKGDIAGKAWFYMGGAEEKLGFVK